MKGRILILVLFYGLSGTAHAAESPCDASPAQPAACAAELRDKMAGTSNVRDWKSMTSITSSYWFLHSMHNGFAMFRSAHDPFFVAVKADSITKELKRGVTLYDTVRCVKWLADTDSLDDKGFPVQVKLYKQVACE